MQRNNDRGAEGFEEESRVESRGPCSPRFFPARAIASDQSQEHWEKGESRLINSRCPLPVTVPRVSLVS